MLPAIERLILMVVLLASVILGALDPPRGTPEVQPYPEDPPCPTCVKEPPGAPAPDAAPPGTDLG